MYWFESNIQRQKVCFGYYHTYLNNIIFHEDTDLRKKGVAIIQGKFAILYIQDLQPLLNFNGCSIWSVTLIGKRFVLKTNVAIKSDKGSSPLHSAIICRYRITVNTSVFQIDYMGSIPITYSIYANVLKWFKRMVCKTFIHWFESNHLLQKVNHTYRTKWRLSENG